MKKYFHFSLMLSFILAVAISGCSGGNSGGTRGYIPGQSKTYTVGNVEFKLHYVPSGSFTSDDSTISGNTNLPTAITVIKAYWMAETEVTNQLMFAVRGWEILNQYYFGANEVISNEKLQHPYNFTWKKAMVWCNALTEYYFGNNTNCVYYKDAIYTTPIRSINDERVDNPYIKATLPGNTDMANCIAKGFRLPTSDEWQLAARYQNGKDWTPGNHVSGDTTGPCWTESGTGLSTVFGNFAWYSGNSVSTHQVASTPQKNALGIYDMSGNVWEWCFDWCPGQEGSRRVLRGGAFNSDASSLQLGFVFHGGLDDTSSGSLGFRFVRTE